jgi:hypothetical protein
MKFFGAVAVLAAATGASASDAGRIPQRVVTACLNPEGNAAILNRGREVATRVLMQAFIRLKWRNDERSCIGAGNGIVVTVSSATPADQPRALAYAMPFERTHLVLFYDRVRRAAFPEVVPYLLGYVLAHEIVHMLQGVERHSASGVMKPRWDNRDYAEMLGARLKFTEDDIDLIHRGLEWRVSRAAPVSDQP